MGEGVEVRVGEGYPFTFIIWGNCFRSGFLFLLFFLSGLWNRFPFAFCCISFSSLSRSLSHCDKILSTFF